MWRHFERDYRAMSRSSARVHRSHTFVLALAVIPWLLTSVSALAASRRAQERAARKACLNGDYAKGVSILSDLFVSTSDPTYLFNQGRCFEQNRRYEDAAARFEEYLLTPGARLSPEDKASAEKHIAACKAKLPKETIESPVQPPPQPVVAPVSPPAPTVPEPAVEVVTQPAPPPAPAQRRWGLLAAGIITGAVGVGGVVTGLVFNLKANSIADELETKVGAYSPSKLDDQKSYKTLAWIGYGVGGACLVAGAALVAVGAARPKSAASAEVALVPSVGPGQVGAMLTGGF
jgi:hypothetical protein